MSKLFNGNSLDQLKNLEANSIDSIVCDPPYGLSFMGKKWDYDVPSVAIWRECLRVLKPGGHLLAFGGTRTYHRMVVNIEDAGFEIRDQVMWIYGSGFPKSHDASKGIDKMNGAKRKVIGIRKESGPDFSDEQFTQQGSMMKTHTKAPRTQIEITQAATETAKLWDGWGSALKPANEPICMARKPLQGPIAENLVRHGTGGLNIDESRVGDEVRVNQSASSIFGTDMDKASAKVATGRWPSNVILDEEAAELLGAAQRFFYVSKPNAKEKNAGLEGMKKREAPGSKRSAPAEGRSSALGEPRENFHPTVKPVTLMGYLIKMVTPKDGTVLDPFMGSGSTGVAAKHLGFNFVGVELSPEYFEIAKARIKKASKILEMPNDRVRAKVAFTLAKRKALKAKKAKSLTR